MTMGGICRIYFSLLVNGEIDKTLKTKRNDRFKRTHYTSIRPLRWEILL